MRILVLSDIHAMSRELVELDKKRGLTPDAKAYSGATGSTYFAEDRPKLQNRILAIGDVLQSYSGEIDALFVLGDMAHQAKTLAMHQVWHDAHTLGNSLGIENIVGIGGNHDIYSRAKSLPEAESLSDHLQSIIPQFPVSDQQVCQEYFADSVASFAIGGCRIVILNTCHLHGLGGDEASVKELFRRGNVSSRMIEKVNSIFQGSEETHFIVAMHHHPRMLPIPADTFNDTMERGEALLSEISKHNRSVLILHGHKHLVSLSQMTDDTSSPVLFSAASLAAEPYPGQAHYFSNQFHLIEFDLEILDRAKGKVYSWDWSDPNWEESTRPHMPHEKPIGMKVDFDEIASKLVTLPLKPMYKQEALFEAIPELTGYSRNDVAQINSLLHETPKSLVINGERLCLIYDEEIV